MKYIKKIFCLYIGSSILGFLMGLWATFFYNLYFFQGVTVSCFVWIMAYMFLKDIFKEELEGGKK